VAATVGVLVATKARSAHGAHHGHDNFWASSLLAIASKLPEGGRFVERIPVSEQS
jgi:hypothetical protein